ncbi:thioredoxin like 1 [Anaeramoeba flamelloides]|uniref:Thioredoxin like n=1 Tax=Anaeramoeba flamelloides TaxID=1746091 RepID=A0AAV7YKV0_9EUKA|nr:thioredoxin like [Anaeramoeba flamelloides]KAJ6228826.1 thioredoxin like 1 [Anaeramoeba flamelloides]
MTEFIDLITIIDLKNSECLNSEPSQEITNILKEEEDTNFITSDTDEQLLVNIQFKQKVKVHSIIVRAEGDGTGPQLMKVFQNQFSFGFEEAQSLKPTHKFKLIKRAITEGKLIRFKMVRFSNVGSLHLFFENNLGGGKVTKIKQITVVGVPLETTNISKIQSVEEKK